MSTKDDDLFGGMFDINGDGKKDFIEKYLEYNYLEESAKSLEGDDSAEKDTSLNAISYRSYRHRSKPSSQTVAPTQPEQPPQPEKITLEKYNSRVKSFIWDCVTAILAFVILSSIPCIIMWAATEAYDPKNSAAGFLTTIIFLVGGFFIIAFLSGSISIIRESYCRMIQTKELYEEQSGHMKEK